MFPLAEETPSGVNRSHWNLKMSHTGHELWRKEKKKKRAEGGEAGAEIEVG